MDLNHGFEIRVIFQLLITVLVPLQELVVALLEILARSQLLSFRDELVKLFIELFLIVVLVCVCDVFDYALLFRD